MNDEQDISKGFWIEGVQNPDKDGNCLGGQFTGYSGKIKVSLSKPKREPGRFGKHTMLFKTVVPDHIYDKLNDTEITRNRGGLTNDTSTHSYTKMSKTISAFSLEALVNAYDKIVQDFLFVLNNEKTPKEKLIFVNWSSEFSQERRSYQNSAKLGKEMKMEFHYFVGYFNGRSFFDIEHRNISTTSGYDVKIPSYTRIQWTQEREEFFDQVFDNFEEFKDKLEEFFTTLDPTTIDSHISKFKMLT